MATPTLKELTDEISDPFKKDGDVRQPILLIYTGGTIGAVPSDRHDPNSPLKIADWKEFERCVPVLNQLRERGILIDAVALKTPLDSSNIVPEEWALLVNIIKKHYDDYDSFVILHGTDTMVYTASALSFMLTGLDKPVIITGSQIPIIDHPHTDGVRNLVNAIRVAAYRVYGIPKVNEVCIAFDKVLLRGNRARKFGAEAISGFQSPNFAVLGKLEDTISIDTKRLWKTQQPVFNPRTPIQPNVISLILFPGIQSGQVLDQLISIPALRGIVLQAYGTGNAPTHAGFLGSIEKGIRKDKDPIVVVDVTQCFSGSVNLGQYETGVGLLQRGVLTGSDMTPEAALCKLMVYLGRQGSEDISTVHRIMQKSQAGEQSESLYTSEYAIHDGGVRLEGQSARTDLQPMPNSDTSWTAPVDGISSAWLHLRDAVIIPSEEEPDSHSVILSIYVNLDPDVEPSSRHPGFAGQVRKRVSKEPSFISIDIRRGLRVHTAGHPLIVTVVLESKAQVTFSGATLLVFVKD